VPQLAPATGRKVANDVIPTRHGTRERARDLYSRLSSLPRIWLLVPLGLLVAWWAGSAVASEGTRRTFALSLAALAVGVPTVKAILGRRLRPGFIAVEVPVLLLLVSTLVFRGRSAVDLAYDPLDAAAQFRVLCVALALILGAVGLISPPHASPSNGRLTSLPIRLYFLYVFVVFLGAPVSVNVPLTAYRGVELLTCLIVMVGARQSVGDEAMERIGTVLYWSVVGLLLSVWVGFILAPEQAQSTILNTNAPLGWQLAGVWPSISSNGVGTLGVLLTFWSLARLRTLPSPTTLQRGLAYAIAGLSVASLILAQYRTGYVAFVAGLLVYLLVGRRWALATVVLMMVVLGVVAIGPSSLVGEAEPYALRGQTTEQASELSGRETYWTAAIPVWEQSPLIGKGLLTATRFEVLAPLGDEYTAGIHSTWVEALVGTGLIGLALLTLSFLVTCKRAFVTARRSGDLVPVLLLAVLGVRTITGNTFETLLSFQAIIFLWLALALSDEQQQRHEAVPTMGPPES
jgi:O-antigen ligase